MATAGNLGFMGSEGRNLVGPKKIPKRISEVSLSVIHTPVYIIILIR